MNQKQKIFNMLSLIYTRDFVFYSRHVRGAVDFMLCLAPKYHGYSISAQIYEFYPHLAELKNLDFTLFLLRVVQLTMSVYLSLCALKLQGEQDQHSRNIANNFFYNYPAYSFSIIDIGKHHVIALPNCTIVILILQDWFCIKRNLDFCSKSSS